MAHRNDPSVGWRQVTGPRALLSERIVTPEGTRAGALLIEGDRIRAVCEPGELPARVWVEDVNPAAILPGLVDTHVHINDPGRSEWEGFATATRAAAFAGYTTLVDMPLNCLPATTTVPALEAKRAAARGKCDVDWMSWGGLVAGKERDLVALAGAGVPGFKCFLIYPGCDGLRMIDLPGLEHALPTLAGTGVPLLVHAELEGPIKAACAGLSRADWRLYSTWLASRPDAAELEAIGKLLELCRQYRFRLHIVHLSTARALPMLRAAREEGLPVTVETCPHYLHFTAEGIAEVDGNRTLFKCAPPIRSAANREALWEGLGEGLIDMIATDHSPCPPDMKGMDDNRFDLAWGGVASLSVAPAVIYSECLRRGFGLEHMVRWMSTAPAALAGLASHAGALAPGREASFVVFDTESGFTVTTEHLHFRHPVSPYAGETLRGATRATWLRGEPVYREGKFRGGRGVDLSLRG